MLKNKTRPTVHVYAIKLNFLASCYPTYSWFPELEYMVKVCLSEVPRKAIIYERETSTSF